MLTTTPPDPYILANTFLIWLRGLGKTFQSNFFDFWHLGVEHIIYKHIITCLESQHILTPLNHGYQAGHSTETQLLTTVHDLVTSFDKDIQVDMAILDFSKAFDKVTHDKLFQKLVKYCIRGPLHSWVSSFLMERTINASCGGRMNVRPHNSRLRIIPRYSVGPPPLPLPHKRPPQSSQVPSKALC